MFVDSTKRGSDHRSMPTRYDQLSDLYDRAVERLTNQHDDARELARHLVTAFLQNFQIDEAEGVVAMCAIPGVDIGKITSPEEVPIEFAVTSDDDINYRFGLILRIRSTKGHPPESVLFPVTLRHIMNDSFEVRPFPKATSRQCAAKTAQHEPLMDLVDQMYSELSDYFNRTVKGEVRRPLGFAVLPD